MKCELFFYLVQFGSVLALTHCKDPQYVSHHSVGTCWLFPTCLSQFHHIFVAVKVPVEGMSSGLVSQSVRVTKTIWGCYGNQRFHRDTWGVCMCVRVHVRVNISKTINSMYRIRFGSSQ